MKKKNQRIAALNISKSQFIIGIVLGLVYAFVFYSFLYLVRESLRGMSITEEYDLWTLSSKEVRFYNLFLAFISVIIGQSICFSFWFYKPKQVFQKLKIRRNRIVHEQRFLNWYFLSWFSKIALIIALVFGNAFEGGFYAFSFYPDYKYLFVLIIVVLFLQTWNAIRINFGAKSLKLMLISAGVITFTAFLISNVNLIDSKAFNEIVLSRKIENRYNFELPESDSYIELKHKYLVSKYYFVEDTVTKRPIIVKDKKEISFKGIPFEMSNFCDYISENEIPFVTYQLHIHKEMKMKYVNPLIREFSAYGSRVGFAVIPKKNKDKKHHINASFRSRYCQYSKGFDDASFRGKYKGFENIIRIKQNEDGSYSVNEVFIKDNKTTIEILKKEIQSNSNYLIEFSMDLNATFASYINILSTCRTAVSELRDAYSLNKYWTKVESLHYEQRSEVYDKFPVRVYELFKY